MQLIVKAEERTLELKAKALAKDLNLEFQSSQKIHKTSIKNKNAYYLIKGKDMLYLQKGLTRKSNPIFCNFLEWSNASYGNSLIKCMRGLPKDCSVVDATAGFGRDALSLATISGSVLLIERLPWMIALLEDAIESVQHKSLRNLIGKFNLISGDSKDYLLNNHTRADVIYLDPMFPNIGNAKAKKNIQALRDLTKEDNSSSLFFIAMELASSRVIVKRHKNSIYINNLKPNFSISGKTVRFDVYKT
jgi:16S rRNA (guanine1516-N2)-methyltransferase